MDNEIVDNNRTIHMFDRKLKFCKLARRVGTPIVSLVFISIYWSVGMSKFY